MKLIADSGSTKCDWMIVGEHGNKIAKTMGFNPFFHTQEFIETQLQDNAELMSIKSAIKEIYYYGAGCSSSDRNQIIRTALSEIFTNASVVHVAEDLDGAAYAASGHNPGIVCIIGTGSNSCYFDGKQVHSRIPALGYVLGDEASGAYFGKIMVSNYLYNLMPSKLAVKFFDTYKEDKESILHATYNKPNANVYLASFMKFASANRDEPWIKQMIYDGIKTFAEIHITSHPEYKTVPVNFVGSIAYYFQDQLDKVANEMGFKVGTIVKKPIEALVDYHATTNVEV